MDKEPSCTQQGGGVVSHHWRSFREGTHSLTIPVTDGTINELVIWSPAGQGIVATLEIWCPPGQGGQCGPKLMCTGVGQ